MKHRQVPQLFAFLLALVAACAPPVVVADQPPVAKAPFDDHTVDRFAASDAFDAFAKNQNGTRAAKFVMPLFHRAGTGARFLAPDFYRMHDEWYWFRLMNGQTVPGPVPEPLQDQSFASLAEIYQTFQGAHLPLELIWVENRIYSVYFYTLALGDPEHDVQRAFAVGTLLHLPADPRRPRPEELWLVLLEEQDLAGEAELLEIFRRLRQTLPPESAQKLQWLPHPAGVQDLNARVWQANHGAFAQKIVRYADLAVPGKAEVYTPGIAAGFLYFLKPGELHKADLPANAIVVLSEIPDELPPVAAILTAVPQTPQAHLNLLAAARGTPNGYVAGVTTDPVLKALASAKVPVVLELGEHGFRYKAWTDVALDAWQRARKSQPPTSVARTNAVTPDVVVLGDDPTTTGPATVHALLPMVGGKAAGIAALFGQPGITPPWRPVALTVNGYALHTQPLRLTLLELLHTAEFADARARLVLLEGESAFRKAYAGDADADHWLGNFQAMPHAPSVDRVLRGGGVQHLIREAPIDARWLAAVRGQLEQRFAPLADDQPLRFRSSSTAEDVEGFNAAGVYSSHSGYLHADRLTGDARKATIERAIRRVWASFWSLDAFAERERGGIDHLNPRMAILVEPSFPNNLEIANGVVLFGVGLDEKEQPREEMTVNVQPGALSVTNPPPGERVVPEIDRVVQLPDGQLRIQRVQVATTHPTRILDDARLRQMFTALHGLAHAWRDARNAGLPTAQQALSAVLDLEFRLVADGWPKLRERLQLPGRLVWKQVRPLSRAPVLTERDVGVPAPVDVRAAAQKVVRRVCEKDRLTVETWRIWTHPSATLLPYAQTPLTLQTTIHLLGRDAPSPPLVWGAQQSRQTWAAWRRQAGAQQTEMTSALADLKRPDGERMDATWQDWPGCADTELSAAPEQALRAWLNQP